MEPGPLEFSELLARLDTEKQPVGDLAERLHRDLLDLEKNDRFLEAGQEALAAIRTSATLNDWHLGAFASAHLAAARALQSRFEEAVTAANDAYGVFNRLGGKHNATIAKALLATIYRKHLEVLGFRLVSPLLDAQAESSDLRSKALAKNQKTEIALYDQQFVEFGEQVRRARWIPALAYALPLVWLPVINSMPDESGTIRAEPVGFMEPLVFVLKSALDVQREQSGDVSLDTSEERLYTARSLPALDGSEPVPMRPPRLKPNAVYAAVKVDPGSAHEVGLRPDDYLLVRTWTPDEKDRLLDQADATYTFRMNAKGEAEVVKPVPPQFVGEPGAHMFNVRVEAILRRVP